MTPPTTVGREHHVFEFSIIMNMSIRHAKRSTQKTISNTQIYKKDNRIISDLMCSIHTGIMSMADIINYPLSINLSINIYFMCCDISILSERISMKHCKTIHQISGHCQKSFTVRVRGKQVIV